MAKTMRADKVKKIELDSEEDPEFQTTLKPKIDDDTEGCYYIKLKTDSRVMEQGDEVALKDVVQLIQKAEGQGDLGEFSG
jgi:flagellar hook-basal body complex protein FliE